VKSQQKNVQFIIVVVVVVVVIIIIITIISSWMQYLGFKVFYFGFER